MSLGDPVYVDYTLPGEAGTIIPVFARGHIAKQPVSDMQHIPRLNQSGSGLIGSSATNY